MTGLGTMMSPGTGSAGRRTGVDEILTHDVVVIGTGVAGLTAALGLAPRRVALLTKARLGGERPLGTAMGGGSSAWAQGGVAAALGEGDSPRLHAADTLAVSGGLGESEVVELLTREGAERVRWLLTLGAAFDRDGHGHLKLGREAAHSRRRILHARGDATGAELVRTLRRAVARAPEVEIFEETFAEHLVRSEGRSDIRSDGGPEGRVVGVLAHGPDGRRVLHLARAVVLATGGLGRLFLHTTNPPAVTGDGLALAARAGARLVDLEFVQFHPTALLSEKDPMPLLTEALRGEGAILVDGAGRRFMVDEHPDAELAPRDVVARAIARRRAAGEPVFLDAREAVGEAFPERFPTVFAAAAAAGIDPRREPMPVSPAAHYHMGGVATDRDGRTSLPGLWACGEVAATGAHGANRLASNSLLEALVFGGRAAADIAAHLPKAVLTPRLDELPPTLTPDPEEAREVIARVRRRMWEGVGVERDEAGLAAVCRDLDELALGHPGLGGEAGNLLLAGRLVARAALERRESRGGHFRRDYPAPDPSWCRHLWGELREKPGGLPALCFLPGRSQGLGSVQGGVR